MTHAIFRLRETLEKGWFAHAKRGTGSPFPLEPQLSILRAMPTHPALLHASYCFRAGPGPSHPNKRSFRYPSKRPQQKTHQTNPKDTNTKTEYKNNTRTFLKQNIFSPFRHATILPKVHGTSIEGLEELFSTHLELQQLQHQAAPAQLQL